MMSIVFVQVGLSFEITQILSICDREFTVKFLMYFRIKWKEPRIIGKGCFWNILIRDH